MEGGPNALCAYRFSQLIAPDCSRPGCPGCSANTAWRLHHAGSRKPSGQRWAPFNRNYLQNIAARLPVCSTVETWFQDWRTHARNDVCPIRPCETHAPEPLVLPNLSYPNSAFRTRTYSNSVLAGSFLTILLPRDVSLSRARDRLQGIAHCILRSHAVEAGKTNSPAGKLSTWCNGPAGFGTPRVSVTHGGLAADTAPSGDARGILSRGVASAAPVPPDRCGITAA